MSKIQVEYIDTNKLVPYQRNPRDNDAAVQDVANSIREFGFKDPIIIDANNTIVCGHTRLKAAKKLRIKQVPCIRATDLSDEQIRAFRLADNKVAEKSTWDWNLLGMELADIEDIDMEEFGFDLDDIYDQFEDIGDQGGYSGDERERTYNAYNLREFDRSRAAGFYEMPTLEPCDVIPDDLIGFNYVLSNSGNTDTGVHFYVDDYQFERLWNQPGLYLDKLRQYQCVLTPDFSLYMDMPMAMKIWNVYRSKLIGQIMQDNGINVIPTLTWAEPETFEFAFDGIPKHSTVSVSTVGVKNSEEAMKVWKSGMDEAIKKLHPKTILVYGGKLDYNYGSIKVIEYSNSVTERMSRTQKGGAK